MNRKGFTLIELLAAITIVAIIGSIAVVGYRVVFSNTEKQYYSSIESNLLLAGNDYFEDHRSELPIGSEINSISVNQLIESKYIEPIADINGNRCTEGTVFAYRENNKFKYAVCLKNCGNYNSVGDFCEDDDTNQKKITISGKGASSNKAYDVNKSYNLQDYSKGEDVIVSFSMSDKYSITKYVIVNLTNSNSVDCQVTSDNQCNKTINKSGSYQVTSYSGDKKISSNYFSVKIAKGAPSFDVVSEKKYTIDQTMCGNNQTTKKINVSIVKKTNEEYKSISYKVKRINASGESVIVFQGEPHGLSFEVDLESGHYEVDVIVKNYSSDEEQVKTVTFNVVYLIRLEYSVGSDSGVHEVVKGYNYDYVSELPKTVNILSTDVNIRWSKDGARIYPINIVEENCSYTIVGETSIPVAVEDFSKYCKSAEELKYTGSEIVLTKEAPVNVTFVNNKATTVGDHNVNAFIDSPTYIWSDGMITDRGFICHINKGDNPIQVVNNQTWETRYSTSSQSFNFQGATNAQGNVTYSIISQPTGNYFSLSGTTLTMAGGRQAGSATSITVRATAAGNSNYNSGYKDIIINIVVDVQPNPMTVVDNQVWNTTFSTSSQNYNFQGASNAQGTVTYSIDNQPSGNYFSLSGTTLTMKANAPARSYNLVIKASTSGNVNYGAKSATFNLTVVANQQKCNIPTNIAVSPTGSVTWTPSSNCSTQQHQVRIGNGSYKNATSGSNIETDLITTAGSKTIYVRVLSSDSNYLNSDDGSKAVTVCNATLAKGVGITNVSGGGNYIQGKELTLTATLTSGYSFKAWTETSGGAQISTSNPYKTTVCNISYTAIASKPVGYVNLSATTGTVKYNGTTTFTVTSHHGGTLSCSTSNSSIATCSVSGTTVTVTGKAASGSATLTVTSSETSNYLAASSQYTVTASKGTNNVTITSKSYTYDGNGKATTATATSGTPSVTYYSDSTCTTQTTTSNATSTGGTPKTVGTYYAKATVAASANYNAGDSGCKQAVVITKATLTCPGSASDTVIYTGSAQSYAGNTCPSGSTGSNASGTDVGTYYGYCTADANHQFSGTCTRATLVINKATNTVTITSKSYTYDGNGKATTATATSGTPSVTYYSNSTCTTQTTTSNATSSGGTPKTVGTYYAKATVAASANYNAGDSGCKQAVVISKATLTCPGNASKSVGYTGSAQSYAGNACPAGSTGSNATGTTLGTYYGYCTADANHQFSGSCTRATLNIVKATGWVTLGATSGSVKYNKTTTFYVTSHHGGTLSCASSNAAVATCSMSGTAVTVTGTGEGTATITVTCAATTYTNSASATYTVSSSYTTKKWVYDNGNMSTGNNQSGCVIESQMPSCTTCGATQKMCDCGVGKNSCNLGNGTYNCQNQSCSTANLRFTYKMATCTCS